jgi:hypothetical protein
MIGKQCNQQFVWMVGKQCNQQFVWMVGNCCWHALKQDVAAFAVMSYSKQTKIILALFFSSTNTFGKTNQKHNTMRVGHHYAQTNTNDINKTWTLLQRTGGNDEPNIVILAFYNTVYALWINYRCLST